MEGKICSKFIVVNWLDPVLNYVPQRKKGLGDDSDSEDEPEDKPPRPSHGAPGDLPPSESESEESSEEEEEDAQPKSKGVEGLIEIENPNRAAKKLQKAKDVDVNAKVELTRKERYLLK